MSEYNANDHLHNVTASVQQLTYQAQGVQDITGANVADYEEISPDASASVTLSNARTGVPFLAMVNNLPPVQDGEGTPALDNVRELIPYTKSVISNGSDVPPIEVVLPSAMYGGYVDYINRRIVLDIVRVRVPYDSAWQATSEATPGVYYAPTTNLPQYLPRPADSRYAVGENCEVKWGSASQATAGCLVLFNGEIYPTTASRLYYQPLESAEITSVAELKTWLEENPLYIYYRLNEPVAIPIDTSIPYVLDNSYTVSAEYGTLTVKYQGIAPDEP